MPLHSWSLRSRQRDANTAAANVRPSETEVDLREQDDRYREVAPLPIERVQVLLECLED